MKPDDEVVEMIEWDGKDEEGFKNVHNPYAKIYKY